MKAILAIDQGTTSTRAIAFSVNGKKLFSSQLEFKQYFPKNGWVEHNPNEIWLKTLKVVKNVTKKCTRKKIKYKSRLVKLSNKSMQLFHQLKQLFIYIF